MEESQKIILKAIDVCKTFHHTHNQYVLEHIDLDIYDNDFTVIMGPSGAGKSTLLYALSGMDQVSQGDILYKNQSIVHMNESQLTHLRSKEFGFVFQQTHLVSYLTLYENVLVAGYTNYQNGNQQVLQRANTLLETMNVAHVKDHLPSQVSGGEAQRAAIARAMINQPGILFADEPTGALNKLNSEQVLDLMSEVYDSGQSILMVTHDIRAALRGTRLIYIEDGKIAGEKRLSSYYKENVKQREADIQKWLTSMEW